MSQIFVETPNLEAETINLTDLSPFAELRGERFPHFSKHPVTILFEDQVRTNPNATAIICADDRLTFGELNARANQLARHLRGFGVGRESLVGLCIDRSLEMAIGLLAILKAGAAYLPLDPEYPKERLAFMLADAQPRVVLTKAALKIEIPDQADAVFLDKDSQAIAANSAANLSETPSPQDLAYVIYTSGSTGKPKGVMITHGNLANYLLALNHELQIDRRDLYLHTTSIAFSSARRQMLLPLSQGASVVIATSGQRKDPIALFQMIKSRAVTVMDAVPSFWRSCTSILSELGEAERCTLLDNRLRLMLSASEPLLADVPRAWMNQFNHPAQHIHMFGQTETAGIVSLFRIPHNLNGEVHVPIGSPIANTDVYVLNEDRQLCAIDEAGELYIGGAGVGRGYLNRPELTTEKFIERNGERLYRTGDWARVRANGRIEFAGRRDQQVKLRGFRIELGEVEASLSQHPSVRECVVVAREIGADTKLIAYFVSKGAEPSMNDLREFLAARLPDYAVPSIFMALDALPLSANGKINRLALPEPEISRANVSSDFIAPQDELERQLASIWRDVLRVEQIGRDDNFFELGGHSLLAAQISARMRRELKFEAPISMLFECPTIALLAAQIQRRTKSPIVTDPILQLPTLCISERGNEAPLSFAQQRLWFVDQLEPDGSSYNICRAIQIKGALEVDKLRRAFETIVARHEILRTNFLSQDGRPFQVINPSVRLPLELTDCRGLPLAERQAEVDRLATAEGQGPFDLAHDPLLRVKLLWLSDDEHLLILTIHHIISDGWSIGVLLSELAALYDAFKMDQTPDLPPLPIQYAEFSLWQRNWLTDAVLEQQLTYWRQQLRDAPAALDLPTDYPRPSLQSFRGAQRSALLPADLCEAIKTLGQREGVTLFMTLLAAFQTLLYRYSGQEDIVVGSPTAGRNMLETEPLIGFFVNTLVLRSDLSGNPSFIELLRRTREVALGAYTHQDVPFEKLVEELHPERNLDRSPLFQVLFTLQNTPMPQFNMNGLTLAPVELNSTTAKFDLSLAVSEEAGRLRARFEYNRDLFAAANVERMLGRFQNLLKAIVADPTQSVTELSLVTESERHQLLVKWNDTQEEFPQDHSIHQLFEEQAARSPSDIAVVCGNERITCGELNARANQLARHLRRSGVGPEVRVAICVERSIDMIVGLLSILKAGGAYVAIEPNYPAERTSFILADSQAKLLLTHQDIVEALPPSDAQILCFETIGERETSESEENVGGLITPESAAHVIYTSGSTGRPKGVVLSHRASVNRFAWMWRQYPFAAGEVCCQKTSLTFADSTWEIFGPLLQGVPLVIISDDAVKDLPRFVEAMTANRVTRLVLVPSLLRTILESNDDFAELLSDLQYCVCSGETLPPDLASQFRKKLPHARLINLYGSSEVAADVTCYEVQSTAGLNSIPIGRPIANTQVYVLDANFQPAPVGVPGEIFVGGMGLAHGYLNRPELTAEKFIPDPFSPNGGARLFRTGDLGCFLPDGNIEYRGRRDHQVKVRGFRIELGEIEATLTTHPLVREAVVIASEDERGDKRLVAYVVGKGEPPAIGELRAHLLTKLPDYMVPSAFVVLDSLPLTTSGKVNRLALPAPDYDGQMQGSYVAPRTPAEELISGIWAEVLKVSSVGVNDNFFELGGHSLLATQVVSRTLKTFGVQLPLRALFEAPTVAGMAKRIEDSREDTTALTPPPITILPRNDAVPLSFGQQSFWFLDGLTPNTSFYNIFRVVRLGGELDVSALEKALDGLMARHESIRTIFPSVDGEPVQAIVKNQKLSLTKIAIDHLSPAAREPELRKLLKDQAHRPFDLVHGPLVRAVLFRLDAEEHVLLLSMHHIVADDWSMAILSRDLKEMYDSFVMGQPPQLPELPIQYPDFTLWQRDCLQNGIFDSQLDYWKRQLAGMPALLELPTDRPRTSDPTFLGAHHRLTLPPALRDRLVKLGRHEGVSLFMTLLAAFQTLLACHSGQDDIVVGSPIAGRNRVEIENLIGYFVNTLVLRTSLAGNPSFSEILGRVREVALGAYAHQETPFGKLVQELQPARSLSHMPLFQAMFVFQNAPAFNLNLSGLSITKEKLFNESSPLDLTLEARETAEGIHCVFEYKTELFDATTIERFAERFQLLLESIVADPTQRFADLSLLTEQERHQLLVEWNSHRLEVPKEACIHHLFEAQVAKTPNAIAAEFRGEQLTYRELNARANQVAHYLRRQGVGPEVLVGISVERSLEVLAAIFGVLKAGGGYVPLDPNYPRDRIAFMIEDAALPLVITQQPLVNEIPGAAQFLCLDSDWEMIALESDANPVVNVDASNVAFVIYTSGSTGNPKGVVIEHRSLVHFTCAATKVYGISRDDRMLQFASLSFDMSAEEIYLSLTNGAALVLRTDDMISSPQDFMRYCREQRVSILDLPTAYWHELTDALADDDVTMPESIRLVIIGGEKASADRFAAWHRSVGDRVRLINTYGPTETTIAVTVWDLNDRESNQSGAIPIGRPIANTPVYVLDQTLRPVPVGVAGELYVGGPGVTRGYLNQPELTAERFVRNPFSDDPSDRLYKTGDVVSYRSNGILDFLGRVDNQIKIRGFRVELEEIEQALRSHEGVNDCVVVLREDHDNRLVAYVVAEDSSRPSASELRNFLRAKLPSYMVPALFEMIDALPLMPNGKINRNALPEPQSQPEIDETFIAPSTPLEALLATAWRQVLNLERVGVQDDFFDLGGHSLLAAKVVSIVRNDLDVQFTMVDVFQAPTVASLANLLYPRVAEKESQNELSRLLEEIAGMSEEEARRHLAFELQSEQAAA